MSEKIETMKAFTRLAISRLEDEAGGLTEEVLGWRACEEANSVRWILTHTAQLGNVFICKVLRGDWDYWPEGWPRDYVDNRSYSLGRIMGDLKKGSELFLEALDQLTAEKLAEEIPFGGGRPREYAVMFLISEIIHHEGQLAQALGTIRRQVG
ncbi:MAG: DinB family protein [Candidatus Bathyarchaeota archaeon]|nr:MAG: DinB family protein [Candidatus Bathyarchaeota archaeon]